MIQGQMAKQNRDFVFKGTDWKAWIPEFLIGVLDSLESLFDLGLVRVKRARSLGFGWSPFSRWPSTSTCLWTAHLGAML
jgi:hypothetical protein